MTAIGVTIACAVSLLTFCQAQRDRALGWRGAAWFGYGVSLLWAVCAYVTAVR